MMKRTRLGHSTRSLAARRLSLAVGAVVLSFGAIVLARAHGDAPRSVVMPGTGGARGGTRATIDTPELEGFFALTEGAVLAHGTRELFGELRLTAREGEGEVRRQPVALAVAVDVSGSMSGEKIEEARRAVRELAARMHAEDRLAVVVYSDGARVLSPLLPIGAARETLQARIDTLYAGGGTNIPAGLSLAAEALSAAPQSMVRRLVLISDGLDGSGLSPHEVQAAVRGRAGAGMTTSALGVGVDYDERFLTGVADAGRGNYDLVAQGRALTAFLGRELEQASATVADRTELALSLPAGWRLAEAWGAELSADRVPLGALFSGERRRVTVRFEIAAGVPGTASDLALALDYRAVESSRDRNVDLGRLSVRVVSEETEVAGSRDVTLHAEAVAQRVDAVQARAVDAWREGRIAEAQQLTQDNLGLLRALQQQAPEAAPALEQRSQALQADYDNFGTVRAESEQGRAYGLGSNSARRARQAAF